MRVRPALNPDGSGDQLLVRDPAGRRISPDGAEVPGTQFWHRRILQGDVELIEPVAEVALPDTE